MLSTHNEQMGDVGPLLDELVLFIAAQLDYVSLYSLYLTCTASYAKKGILEPLWEKQIHVHFPTKITRPLKAKYTSYQGLFSKKAQSSYTNLNKRQKRLCALIMNADLKNLEKEKITDEDISQLTPFMFNVHNDEVKHHVFDRHKEPESYGTSTLKELINLGIKSNLSQGRFKEYLSYFHKHNLRLPDEISLLYFAASRNSAKTVAMLLELRMIEPGAEETSPLYIAAQEGYLECVKLLVANNADIEFRYREGFTPLYIAAQRGKLDVVKFLHENGANIHVRCRYGSSPLYIAAQEGQLNVVDYLLSQKADYTINFRTGFTPLYVAARNGRTPCVTRILQEEKVNIDAADLQGSTPLYVAAQNGKHETCEVLLKAGANAEPHFLDGYTPLYVASQNSHPKVILALCQNRPNLLINHVTPNGSTSIYVAAQNGSKECVKILCEYGADVNTGLLNGYAPLYVAAQKGYHDVVKILLKFGANIDSQTRRGATALYGAVQNGHIQVAEILLHYGANPNLAFHNGTTPLQNACSQGNDKLIKLLLQHGANLLAKDNFGETALKCINSSKLKNKLSVLINKIFDQPLDVCYPKIPFNIMVVVSELAFSPHITEKIKTLLLEACSDFARFVILYSILENLDKRDPFVRDVVHALGYESGVTSKLNLYNALFDYLGNRNALALLVEYVIKPLGEYIKYPYQLESILFCLAYFEGQVKMALPKQAYIIKKTIPQKLLEENANADKSTTPDEIVAKVKNILSCYDNHLAVKNLRLNLDNILNTTSMKDVDKILEIKQTVVDFYYNARMFSSQNLFVGCSTLADILEKVINMTLEYPVPHFIAKGTPIPDVSEAGRGISTMTLK